MTPVTEPDGTNFAKMYLTVILNPESKVNLVELPANFPMVIAYVYTGEATYTEVLGSSFDK